MHTPICRHPPADRYDICRRFQCRVLTEYIATDTQPRTTCCTFVVLRTPTVFHIGAIVVGVDIRLCSVIRSTHGAEDWRRGHRAPDLDGCLLRGSRAYLGVKSNLYTLLRVNLSIVYILVSHALTFPSSAVEPSTSAVKSVYQRGTPSR